MKVVDCITVRFEIDSADADWQPEPRIQEHLRGCRECQRVHEQGLQLRRLIGGLGTIAAPADFDFKLRARLANDKAGAVRRVRFGGIAFGIPSLALTALLLVVGAAYLYRSMSTQPESPVAAATDSGSQPSPTVGKTALVSSETGSTSKESTTPPNRNSSSTILAVARPKSPRPKPASNQRTVSEDFSNTAAQVIKHRLATSDEVAAFPIDSPAQSLQLSLDDGNGVSRTISLPRISFGSQRFVATDSPALIKTKGVW